MKGQSWTTRSCRAIYFAIEKKSTHHQMHPLTKGPKIIDMIAMCSMSKCIHFLGGFLCWGNNITWKAERPGNGGLELRHVICRKATFDEGWKTTRGRKKTYRQAFEQCLPSLPMTEGGMWMTVFRAIISKRLRHHFFEKKSQPMGAEWCKVEYDQLVRFNRNTIKMTNGFKMTFNLTLQR